MGKVVRQRKGKPIEVDEQIIRWRKRRQKEAKQRAERKAAVKEILAAFAGDPVRAEIFLKNYIISPYNKTPAELIRNNKLKAVRGALERHMRAQVPGWAEEPSKGA